MTQDAKNVQPDEASEGAESKEEKPQEQPLTREEVQRMIAEQAEQAKREIQSAKDKAMAEVASYRKRAQSAEGTLADLEEGFGEIDPERANQIKTKAKLKEYQRKEVEESQRQAMQQAVSNFESTLSEYVNDLGIDPNDNRLDWGKDLSMDSPGYFLSRQSKFLKSIAKIQKENKQATEDKRSQEQKDKDAKLRKDIDSVETSAAPAPGVDLSKLSSTEMIKLGLKEGTGKRKK